MAVLPEEFTVRFVRARRLVWEDSDEFFSLHNDPAVMATLGGMRDRATTTEYMTKNIAHWDDHGYGMYALRHMDDDRHVGRAGLRQVEIEGVGEIEVGYALMSEFRGNGLAVDVTEALVSLASAAEMCETLVAFTLPTNHRSRRVMEKSGFLFERRFDHGGSPHVLYRRRL
ncbi:MAG: GNAT family N-acetyltransferase [Acidimicrobiales bacterium]